MFTPYLIAMKAKSRPFVNPHWDSVCVFKFHVCPPPSALRHCLFNLNSQSGWSSPEWVSFWRDKVMKGRRDVNIWFLGPLWQERRRAFARSHSEGEQTAPFAETQTSATVYTTYFWFHFSGIVLLDISDHVAHTLFFCISIHITKHCKVYA